MKAVSIVKIKKELEQLPSHKLVEVCLNLAKFKKENKELITYLLFQETDETAYIQAVKEEIDAQFLTINTQTYYYIKKTVRKILRSTKKYIRYSKKPETEVTLILYFCHKLSLMQPSYAKDTTLLNLFNRQIIAMEKTILKMHEDLQYDFTKKIEDLIG